MRISLIRLAPLAALLALSGCISFGEDPPPTLLNLTPDTPESETEITGSVENALIVEEPSTSQRLAVTRVPVQIDASNVAYLQDAMWVERPTRLMQALIAETVRARSGRVVFEGDDTDASGGTLLSGRLLEMGYDARDGSVIVRFDALLHREGQQTTARRFESRIPGIAPEANAVGPALNRAANDVAGQIADWISG
ncbi:MAG: ABC-type transport auxiliary lipoprotein family protein [Sphingomonadaceae bacterium]